YERQWTYRLHDTGISRVRLRGIRGREQERGLWKRNWERLVSAGDRRDESARGLQLHHLAGVSPSVGRRTGCLYRFQKGGVSGSRTAAVRGCEFRAVCVGSQQSEQSRFDCEVGRRDGQQHALLPRPAGESDELADSGYGRRGQPGELLRSRSVYSRLVEY